MATIVARMIAGPLKAARMIGDQVAPALAMAALEARAVTAPLPVARQEGAGVLAAAAVLAVVRRLLGGQAAMTLAVIAGHVLRVGPAPAATPVARADVMPADAKMEAVPAIGVMGPVAVAGRPRVVVDAQMVAGAPREQAGAAAVPEVEPAVAPDLGRDQDAPTAHGVPRGRDVPMGLHQAARAAVVLVVEDVRPAVGAAGPGDHQAMPVVVIETQVVVVMRECVVATDAMERGHRARNRARQRSGVRRRCGHAVAECAKHRTSPVHRSRNVGKTLALSMRSGDVMK